MSRPEGYRTPASNNKRWRAVCTTMAEPCSTSTASTAQCPAGGGGSTCHDGGRQTKASKGGTAHQRACRGTRHSHTGAASRAHTPSQNGNSGHQPCAQGHVAMSSSTARITSTAQAATLHSGAHTTPNRLKGTTTRLTQGMAKRLAPKPTHDRDWKHIKATGASTRVARHCVAHNPLTAALTPEGGASPPISIMVPTATNDSQKLACCQAQGSITSTTTPAQHHTRGQGHCTPTVRSTVTAAIIHTVRCAGMPQPDNKA